MPLGTQGKYQATSRKVFSVLDSDGLTVFLNGATQHNEGSNPKTGRVRDPTKKKTSRRDKFRNRSAMRKFLIAWE